MDGIIKKFFDDKGFGFIKTDKEEIFFHVSELAESVTLAEGMKVSFEVGKGDRGTFAKNIRVVAD
ncbi:MAG: cold-shock protein [Gammaproteobacteria bacterium]|nr:MAG: cold-shock protein [Gammaproteobacteria bacterium]